MTQTPHVRKTLEPIETYCPPTRGGRRYAIVDPAPVHGLPRDYVPDDTEAFRLKPRQEDDPDSMPWLFEIEPRHQRWLKERMPVASWGILIDTGASAVELQAVLSDMLLAVDPDGSEVLLRYYDPRVLAPLLESMSERELGRWFGVVRSFGRNFHERMQWFTPTAPSSVMFNPLARGPFQLRVEHLQAFVDPFDHALADEIRAFIEDQRPGVLDGIEEPESYQLIAAGVSRAKSHDLREVSDLATFVALMFDVAPNFDEQPEIRGYLSLPFLPGSARLRLAIEMTSAQAWEEAEENANAAAWGAGSDLNRPSIDMVVQDSRVHTVEAV